MSFLKRLGKLFTLPVQKNDQREYWITVRCNRCSEEVRGRIDLWNELSWSDPDAANGSTYTCRKVLIGEGICFQRIEVILAFDSNRRVIDRQISGGTFLD